MKSNFILYKSLHALRKSPLQVGKVCIAPIRFKEDPSTGIYMKCPVCGEVGAYGFIRLDVEPPSCTNISCDYNPDVEGIKAYICKLETFDKKSLKQLNLAGMFYNTFKHMNLKNDTLDLKKDGTSSTVSFKLKDEVNDLKVTVLFHNENSMLSIYIEKTFVVSDKLVVLDKLNTLTLKSSAISFYLNENMLVCRGYYNGKDSLEIVNAHVNSLLEIAKTAFISF